MDNIDNEMSSNINELSNMQKLSNNIQKELDNGKASNYLDQQGLDTLQQMQLKQLQDLQKMQELQLRKKKDEDEDEVDSESDKPQKKKKRKKDESEGMIKLLQDPMIVLALYILISHPTILGMIGHYVPNLVEGEEGLSLTNLFIRGVILVSIYFGLKMFVLI
jgi:hypothetical protein